MTEVPHATSSVLCVISPLRALSDNLLADLQRPLHSLRKQQRPSSENWLPGTVWTNRSSALTASPVSGAFRNKSNQLQNSMQPGPYISRAFYVLVPPKNIVWRCMKGNAPPQIKRRRRPLAALPHKEGGQRSLIALFTSIHHEKNFILEFLLKVLERSRPSWPTSSVLSRLLTLFLTF